MTSTTDHNTIEYERCLRVREHIIGMSGNGGCFIGASLSCVEILCSIYTHCVDIDAIRRKDPNRDVVLLSKGHDVPALYALFVELDILDRARLANHLSTRDDIYWHPNTNIHGVEFHSGSLGHLLSVGMGMALDKIWTRQQGRVIIILGDGELNEGSVWEACQVARALHLHNICLVVDRNKFQANMQTEELIPLEPLADKFKAFGFATYRCDGHDISALNATFDLAFEQDGPSVIIADTIRGKGLPSIEARADRWFCNFSVDEREDLLRELHGQAPAHLTSTPLVVR